MAIFAAATFFGPILALLLVVLSLKADLGGGGLYG